MLVLVLCGPALLGELLLLRHWWHDNRAARR